MMYYWIQAQPLVSPPQRTSKKIKWDGVVSANTTFYGTNSTFNKSNPLSANLNSNLTLNIAEVVDVPISFTVGSYQHSSESHFLQCNISPHYRWATLHAGNINLTFNPYTLAGISFWGIGTELNPGKFRFSALYGQLTPAVEIDTTGNSLRPASFRRIGYGVKMGYGNGENFIDLIYFHAKDAKTSITSWQDPKVQQKLGDAALLTPQENNVVGLSSRLALTDKLNFNMDGGITFLNKNIADTQQTKPKGINISNTNKLQYAGKASLGYNIKDFTISANYERVVSDYTTLGSYFFNNDIENIILSPAGTFSKGKGNYNVSFGIQKNNLDKTKIKTTHRFIGSGNIFYNPTEKWILSANYNNFMTREFALQPISDSFLLRQVNQTFSFTPTYVVRDSLTTHTFSFTANYNDVNDRNILTKKFGNMRTAMCSFNHSSLFANNSINSGINLNQIKSFIGNNVQIGATLGYGQSFLQRKINANVNINLNISYVDGQQDGSVLNGSASASYEISSHHFLTFNTTLINTNSKKFDSYAEILGSVTYQLRLN